MMRRCASSLFLNFQYFFKIVGSTNNPEYCSWAEGVSQTSCFCVTVLAVYNITFRAPLTNEQVDMVVNSIDTEDDGTIDYQEFLESFVVVDPLASLRSNSSDDDGSHSGGSSSDYSQSHKAMFSAMSAQQQNQASSQSSLLSDDSSSGESSNDSHNTHDMHDCNDDIHNQTQEDSRKHKSEEDQQQQRMMIIDDEENKGLLLQYMQNKPVASFESMVRLSPAGLGQSIEFNYISSSDLEKVDQQ